MTPFTDEDLKRLKELLDVNYSGYPMATVQETMDFLRFKIDALLARMEAAERHIESLDALDKDGQEAEWLSYNVILEAWRKASGK